MKYYGVGKIVNTHGVRGEVRVISSTDFPEERYKKGSQLLLEHDNVKVEVTVDEHRKHKQFDLLKFKGYENINEVEKFKGGSLKVSEEHLGDLGENEFYYHEIINCEVFTEDGELLGSIKEILSPGANDVWVVERKGAKDVLVPYIEDVVKDVDVENKKVVIHILEGLLD